MSQITETNAQYYAGQQDFGTLTSGPGLPVTLAGWGFNTLPVSAFDSSGNQIGSVSNYVVYYDNGTGYVALNEDWSYIENHNQILVRSFGSGYNGKFYVQLKQFAINNNYGSYEYITLGDIINNFIVGYVGAGKLIPGCKRTDIMFHAKRGLQEFSYDTLKCIKSQELTIPPSLSLPIPQDYVNYVKITWVDDSGIEHIIYPTSKTSNPKSIKQNADGSYVFNNDTTLAEQTSPNSTSETHETQSFTTNTISLNFSGVYKCFIGIIIAKQPGICHGCFTICFNTHILQPFHF